MNEDKKNNNIMETNGAPASEPPLTWRDAAIPLLALALALIFWADFDPFSMGWPHWGVPALVCAHFAAVLVVLGKQAYFHTGGVFCMAASLALSVSCALYKSAEFFFLNCFVILLVAAMGTFALSGRLSCGTARAIPDTIKNAFLALFTRLGRPFQALLQFCRKGTHNLEQIALAVLAAVPVLAVVLWLLASADTVFASLFDGLRWLAPSGDLIRRVLEVTVLTPFLASALYFIREEPVKTAEAEKPDKPSCRALPFLVVTALLDIVYIIFCSIQVKYLFGGREAASMAGGWAEYARSGFFQLVTITFINLGLFLLGANARRFAGPGGKALRGVFGLLLALTAVILVSAFWRMRLYIRAYGMSVLRLLTLWIMAVIMAGILTAGWKLVRPGFGFFRAAGSFALALWCCMNLAGPVRMIANYNVDKYLSGELAEVDVFYLQVLGPDAEPALEKLDAAGGLKD